MLVLLGFVTSAAAVAQDAPAGAPRAAQSAAPYTLPDVFNAQTHASPTAPPKPGHIAVSGKVRAYDFQRVNHVQNAANPNRHAYAIGITPHFAYRVGDSPIIFGYTYGGSTGFGLNGPNPIKNGHVDNTLPGFPLNDPIHEAYVQYNDGRTIVTAGDQELNYSWTPSSDSRIIPASYQGVDASFKLAKTLTFGITRIDRFEQRNSSNFEPNTLLTAPYPGSSSLFAGSGHQTPGTLRESLTYKPIKNLTVSAENYEFYDIADLSYTEARYGFSPQSKRNPYLAIQYVTENGLAQKQVGRIDNHTIGAQLGASVTKNIGLAVSADSAPWKYALVNAGSTGAASAGYFLPSGGTGTVVRVAPGRYKVAYGGIASPYTDSEATDPLYTTSITQGMADRRSAGNSYKAAATFTSNNKQFKLLASEAWYQYSNDIAKNLTSEFNVDGTYYFNKVRPGPYKGFFVRVRVAPRTVPAVPYNFQYQRFQTEYDF